MVELESQAAIKSQLDALPGPLSNVTFPSQFKVLELFFLRFSYLFVLGKLITGMH